MPLQRLPLVLCNASTELNHCLTICTLSRLFLYTPPHASSKLMVRISSKCSRTPQKCYAVKVILETFTTMIVEWAFQEKSRSWWGVIKSRSKETDACIHSLHKLRSGDIAPSSRMIVQSSTQIWSQSLLVYHYHLCPGMMLDSIGYINGMGDHALRTFPEWPQIWRLSPVPNQAWSPFWIPGEFNRQSYWAFILSLVILSNGTLLFCWFIGPQLRARKPQCAAQKSLYWNHSQSRPWPTASSTAVWPCLGFCWHSCILLKIQHWDIWVLPSPSSGVKLFGLSLTVCQLSHNYAPTPGSSTEPINSYRGDYGQWDAHQPSLPIGLATGCHHTAAPSSWQHGLNHWQLPDCH
jgi:hypothetical protein